MNAALRMLAVAFSSLFVLSSCDTYDDDHDRDRDRQPRRYGQVGPAVTTEEITVGPGGNRTVQRTETVRTF